MCKRIIVPLFSVLIASALNAQITLDPIAVPITCPGNALDISFQSGNVFSAGNTFIVELSDALGSFAAPVTIGNLNSTSPGTISCTNFGGADGSGYRLRVRSTMPVLVSGNSVETLTFPTPDAGISGIVTLCGIIPSFDFATLLSGSPDTGGSWTISMGTGVLVSPPSGQYTSFSYGTTTLDYTVVEDGCSISSSASVMLVEPPNAGTNTALALCSNNSPVNLFDALGGTPFPGGVWTSPNGGPISGMFDPAIDPSGVYVYVVPATPPCANATSTVFVTVVAAPNAGTDATHTLCTSDGPFDMFAALQDTPEAGGMWASSFGPHSAIYNPATDNSGPFTYTVAGVSPCASASATLTVVENNCFNAPAASQCNCPVQ